MSINVEYFQVGDLLKVKKTEEVKEISEIEDGYIVMSDNTTYTIEELEDVTLEEMNKYNEKKYWDKYDRGYGDFREGDIINYNGDILVIASIEEIAGAVFVVCTNGRTIFDVLNMKIDTFVELRRKDEEF